MSYPTRYEAIDRAEAAALEGFLENPVFASFRAYDGYRAYAARSEAEARNWLGFNRSYMHPGSDQINRR